MCPMENKACGSPFVFEPITLPQRECVINRCYCVEQPIICPCNTRIVNHYIPRPVYYYTYSQTEENVCHGNGKTIIDK